MLLSSFDSIGKSVVYAIVVTYEPEDAMLEKMLLALVSQVSSILVVDNASRIRPLNKFSLERSFPKLNIHLLQDNQGVASAQNYGISLALLAGASHLLILDQDSVADKDMVRMLLMGLWRCEGATSFKPVAAIAPARIDSRTEHVSGFILSDKSPFVGPMDASQGNDLPTMDVGFLISSGMLIPAYLFEKVGGLRSDYFIDHVDTEWCFRVRAAGYRLVGLELPLLRHSLGDEVHKVWLFRVRHVSTHAPLRDYYMARNTLAMIKGGDLSVGWCMHFLWRIVQFLGFYVLLSNNKRQHLKMLFLGLAHGLRGISGKLNSQTLQTEPLPRSPLDPD